MQIRTISFECCLGFENRLKLTPQGSVKVSNRQRRTCPWTVRTICMRWYIQNFVGRYFYERTLFEADDQCQKHQLGLNYRSGWKKLGPLESGTDRKFSDLPNGLKRSSMFGGRNFRIEHSGDSDMFSHRQDVKKWTRCEIHDLEKKRKDFET